MRTTFIVKELPPPHSGKSTPHAEETELVEVLGLVSLLAGRPIAPKLAHVSSHPVAKPRGNSPSRFRNS